MSHTNDNHSLTLSESERVRRITITGDPLIALQIAGKPFGSLAWGEAEYIHPIVYAALGFDGKDAAGLSDALICASEVYCGSGPTCAIRFTPRHRGSVTLITPTGQRSIEIGKTGVTVDFGDEGSHIAAAEIFAAASAHGVRLAHEPIDRRPLFCFELLSAAPEA